MMIKRSNLEKIHLYCACICAVIILIFAFSGSLHLLGFKEPQKFSVVGEVSHANFFRKDTIESNVKTYFKENQIDYDYEYVKLSGDTAVTRPTTRNYYQFKKSSTNTVVVSKVVPSIWKRLLEFHKGHGRKFTRIVNAFFGLSLVVTIFSGLWLGLQIKRIRKLTIGVTLVSLTIFFIEFYS